MLKKALPLGELPGSSYGYLGTGATRDSSVWLEARVCTPRHGHIWPVPFLLMQEIVRHLPPRVRRDYRLNILSPGTTRSFLDHGQVVADRVDGNSSNDAA